MQRDQFQIEVETPGEDAPDGREKPPVLILHFDGSRNHLKQVLTRRLRDDASADGLDVSWRYLSSANDADEGVFGLNDRLTGDLILECEVEADSIREFVQAVREYAEQTGRDTQYEVCIRANGGSVANFETRILLVYDVNGTLLRDASLIPSEVEM